MEILLLLIILDEEWYVFYFGLGGTDKDVDAHFLELCGVLQVEFLSNYKETGI